MKNHQAVYINYDEVQPDEVSMSHVVKSIGLDFFQLQAAISINYCNILVGSFFLPEFY